LIFNGHLNNSFFYFKGFRSNFKFKKFRHGFGNWSEIADFIGTNKTRDDVQDHYINVYLEA
jgi:hypothetical protein